MAATNSSGAASARSGITSSSEAQRRPLSTAFAVSKIWVFRRDSFALLGDELDQVVATEVADHAKELETLRGREAKIEAQIQRLWAEIKKADDPDDPLAELARSELRSLAQRRKR